MRNALWVVVLTPFITGLACRGGAAMDPVEVFKKERNCADENTRQIREGSNPEGQHYWRINGCRQTLDCRVVEVKKSVVDEPVEVMRCFWPYDVNDARDRLAAETGCPVDQIEPVSRNSQFKKDTIRREEVEWEALTYYRLKACGRPFVCTLTTDNPLNEGAASIDCKPALEVPPAPAAPPVDTQQQ